MIRTKVSAIRRRIGSVVWPAEATDLTDAEKNTLDAVGPFTMTSADRIIALTQAVEYLERRGVPGSIVECGVWRGGSMMAVARTLLAGGSESRDLYLFDTYEGMSNPSECDRDHGGSTAAELLAKDPGVSCVASEEEVRVNLGTTGYPSERLHFERGLIETTIPERAPEQIALLRLDTDWYESTKHELEHLYPRVSEGGVVIIDDYGHWQGAKRAVDEYFEGKVLLHRIDYSARLVIKNDRNSGEVAAGGSRAGIG